MIQIHESRQRLLPKRRIRIPTSIGKKKPLGSLVKALGPLVKAFFLFLIAISVWLMCPWNTRMRLRRSRKSSRAMGMSYQDPLPSMVCTDKPHCSFYGSIVHVKEVSKLPDLTPRVWGQPGPQRRKSTPSPQRPDSPRGRPG